MIHVQAEGFAEELVKISTRKQVNVIRDGERVWKDWEELTPDEESDMLEARRRYNERFPQRVRKDRLMRALGLRPDYPTPRLPHLNKTSAKEPKEKLKYRAAQGSLIAKGIPIAHRMPKKPEAIHHRLEQLTDPERTNVTKVLGYSNVAIPKKSLPPLEELGFKPTRIATPLPGEKAFTISYRKGKLHAHQMGPVYLIHQDKHDPRSGRMGYVSLGGVKHGVTEGIPSVIKRFKEKQSLVKERVAGKLREAADRVEK